jgi:hypothetical protein
LGETGAGAEAGVVGGLVFGVAEGVIAYNEILAPGASSTAATILPTIGTVAEVLQASASILFIGTVVISLILGTFIGGIYGILYERIPAVSSYAKALLVAAVPWAVVFVALPAIEAGLSYPIILHMAGGLVATALFALTLGFLYPRNEARTSKINPFAS